MIIGYARVSTEDQTVESQRSLLRAAGCAIVHKDVASGASRSRPELARCMESLKRGDVLVVTRLDRLGRSLQHLLELVSSMTALGVGFRSLAENFDTSSAQGRLMMQMLGAFAEFEREIIRERTMTGLAHARSQGRIGGNPLFKAKDRHAIAMMKSNQADTFLKRARETSAPWLDLVIATRPARSWDGVARRINAAHPGSRLTTGRLIRTISRLVAAGDVDPVVMEHARNRDAVANDSAEVFAKNARMRDPDLSLRRLADLLTDAGYRPPRASDWSASGVRSLLLKVERDESTARKKDE